MDRRVLFLSEYAKRATTVTGALALRPRELSGKAELESTSEQRVSTRAQHPSGGGGGGIDDSGARQNGRIRISRSRRRRLTSPIIEADYYGGLEKASEAILALCRGRDGGGNGIGTLLRGGAAGGGGVGGAEKIS